MKILTPPVLWLYGLSGAGKSTLALALQEKLRARECQVVVLDGDIIREGLSQDLGFSQQDRQENIRRTAEMAKMLMEQGIWGIAALITPLEQQRKLAASIIGPPRYLDIFIDCPLEICEQRDVKGLYEKARKQVVNSFTGLGSAFEVPAHPFLQLHTNTQSLEYCLLTIEKNIEPFF